MIGVHLSVHEPAERLRSVALRYVVDVDHRRRHVQVAHVRLDVGQRPHLYGQGAEGVAQIVERHRLIARALVIQARRGERRVEPTSRVSVVQVAARRADEDEVLGFGEVVAPTEGVECLGRLVDQRDLPDFGVRKRLWV